MKKKIKNTDFLGKRVHPIVKWDYYTDPDHLTGGAHHYVDADTRNRMCRSAADEHKKQLRKDYREQEWYVYGIFCDDTFELRSTIGYSLSGVKRNDFRLINKQLT